MNNNNTTVVLTNYTLPRLDPYVIYGVTSGEVAVESAILLIISSVAFTANASLWLVVVTTRDLRTESNVLILCLSLADLLVAIVGAPITLSSIISSRWLFSSAVCTFVGYLNMLTFVASVQSLGAISINRYFKICRPAKYLDIYTFSNVGWMFLAVWLYSGILSIPPLVGWASYDFLPLASICFCNWSKSPSFAIFMILMCFCVPCFAMILCYVAIIKAFLRSRRTVQEFANSIKKKNASSGDVSFINNHHTNSNDTTQTRRINTGRHDDSAKPALLRRVAAKTPNPTPSSIADTASTTAASSCRLDHQATIGLREDKSVVNPRYAAAAASAAAAALLNEEKEPFRDRYDNNVINVQENLTGEEQENSAQTSSPHNRWLKENNKYNGDDSFARDMRVRIQRPPLSESFERSLSGSRGGGERLKEMKSCNLRHTVTSCHTGGATGGRPDDAVFSDTNTASHGPVCDRKMINRKNAGVKRIVTNTLKFPLVDRENVLQTSSFLSSSDDFIETTQCDLLETSSSHNQSTGHLLHTSSARDLSQFQSSGNCMNTSSAACNSSTGNILQDHSILLDGGNRKVLDKKARAISLNYEMYRRTPDLGVHCRKFSKEWPSYDRTTYSKCPSNEASHLSHTFNSESNSCINKINSKELTTEERDASGDECDQNENRNRNTSLKTNPPRISELPHKSNLLQLPSAYSLEPDTSHSPSSASTSLLASSDLSSFSSNQQIHFDAAFADSTGITHHRPETPSLPNTSPSLRLSKSEEQLSKPSKTLRFDLRTNAEEATTPLPSPLSRKSAKFSASSPSVFASPSERKGNHRVRKAIHSQRRTREEFQLAASLLVVILIFIVCWFPYCISMFISFTDPDNSSHALDMASLLLGYMNSCVNPLVYGMMNRRFKNGYRHLYARCLRYFPFTNKSKSRIAPLKQISNSTSSLG